MAFLTKSGSELQLDGKPYKYIGFNAHNALNTDSASLVKLFSQQQARNCGPMRMWCFPPSFQYLEYPIINNILLNGGLEEDASGYTIPTGFSRSNEQAFSGAWSIKQQTNGGYAELRKIVTVEANRDYVWTIRHLSNHISNSYESVLRVRDTEGVQIHDLGFIGTGDKGTTWKQKQVLFNSGNRTQLNLCIQSWGGNVLSYYDDFSLCLQQPPVLVWNPDGFQRLDYVADLARIYGVKLHLSFADNTPNLDTKGIVNRWANLVYNAGIPQYNPGTTNPSAEYFSNTYTTKITKDFMEGILTHQNSINGRIVLEDDSYSIMELGNEMRTDRYEGVNVNGLNSENLALMSRSGGWADRMSTFVKSIDPNHLVCFSSASHGWQYVPGDSVHQGTYTGVSFKHLAEECPNIDILSYHCYPTQGAGELQLLKYGQKLGHPNTVSGQGFKDQLKEYISVTKSNNKVPGMGEVGQHKNPRPSNQHYPLFPRHAFAQQLYKDWLDQGASFINWWSATTDPEGGAYSVVLDGVSDSVKNIDDRPFMSLIHRRNFQLKGERLPIIEEYGLTI